MACTKEELRKRVEATPVASNGKAMFTPDLRHDAVEYSTARRAQTGESVAAVATELGLKGWTLQRWHQNERKAGGGGGDAGFVEVTAPRRRGRPAKVAVAEAPSFEVSCPNGYEVRVPAAFEARALRELLSALDGGR
jgi:transposase-like protein